MRFSFRRIFLFILGTITTLIGVYYGYQYFFKKSLSPLSCNTLLGSSFSYKDISIKVLNNGRGISSSRYPGCNEQDQVIWTCENGRLRVQVWASCDIGSKRSYIEEYRDNHQEDKKNGGIFYTWGSGIGVDSEGRKRKKQYSFLENPWLWLTTDSPYSGSWDIDNRGPCSVGYSVPSIKEWEYAKEIVSKEGYSLQDILGFQKLGLLIENGERYNIGNSYYWSSTQAYMGDDPFAPKKDNKESGSSDIAFSVIFPEELNGTMLKQALSKKIKLPIRCIRNIP